MRVKIKSQPTKDLMVPEPSYTVYAVSWTESEAGWGCRGDGWSVHKDAAEVKKYQKEYWDRQPKNYVPTEYSRPDTEEGKLIKVSKELYDLVHRQGTVRLWENNPDFENYKTKK